MADLTPRQIYAADRDVAWCVDIIAALASYKGGYFYLGEQWAPTEKVLTSDEVLREVARDVYIDGIALAELRHSTKAPELATVPSGKKPTTPTITFDYLGGIGFLKSPRSPLGMAAINYESEDRVRRAILARPEMASQLNHMLRPTTGEMGFPAFLLSQQGIDSMQAWQLSIPLHRLLYDAGSIRHFMRSVLVNELIEKGSEYSWDWNIDFKSADTSGYLSPVYHVFRNHGLDLKSVRVYEIDSAKAAVEAGLFPSSYLTETMHDYGL